jgi:VEFS-Box of polycomb protein
VRGSWERVELERALQHRFGRVDLRQQYVHNASGEPVRADEQDVDSDSDEELRGNLWEVRREVRTLARAEDLAPHEARFFALWNAFATHYRVYADYVVPRAVLAFARAHGREVLAGNLRGALLCHCLVLWEEGLLDSDTMLAALEIVDSFAVEDALLDATTRALQKA